MTTSKKKKKQHKQAEPINFPVPEELKLSPVHIKWIAIEGDYFVIEHDRMDKNLDNENPHDHIRFQITGNHEEDMTTLKTWAKTNFFFIDNPDFMVDLLVNCVSAIYYSKEGSSIIAKIKAKNERQIEEAEEEEEAKLKKQYIQKYYAKSENVLYEAVIIAGKPYFVNLEWDFKTNDPFVRLSERLLLPDAKDPTMELLPPESDQYLSKPFEFASEHEINKYLKLVTEQTLDKLFRTQKNLASKYIDANDTHLTLLAADGIASYFQDKLGQTHYDMFVGDNDTGKSTNLVYLQYEGYRAMLDVSITPANIYGFLGTFEEGQGIILEDEADDIHTNQEKMKIYKSGYNAGKKVTRTDLTGFSGRKLYGWNTYCFKAFTAEQAPDNNKAKGFLDRTFIFHCIRGDPAYDIQEVTNPAGDQEHTELLNELIHNRKLLFAYRLLCTIKIPFQISSSQSRTERSSFVSPSLDYFRIVTVRNR